MVAREREPAVSRLLYHLFKWSVVSPVLHGYWRGRIEGAERVPQTGPLIVASNHASNFDPPLVANCVQRPVAFMAKEELFRVPVLKQAIALYGAYPVKRNAADRSAIRAALQALKQGWAVGIFLQGTRTPDGRITAPKLGAAAIAAQAQAPILPVSLWGTERILSPESNWPLPMPVTVRIGTPLPPPRKEREALQAATDRCAEAINALHAQGR